MTPATLATPITEDDHAQGPANAAIKLVQYGDYECPYTRLSRHSVHQLQREFPNRMRFVFRHFPLEEIHAHARAAAAAAEAAGHQTDFWTMHEYLFEHQRALEDADFKKYASEMGLDSERFGRDSRSPEVQQRIDRDLASGDQSGVEGTPTFYVNGSRHDSGYDLDSLRTAIIVHLDRFSAISMKACSHWTRSDSERPHTAEIRARRLAAPHRQSLPRCAPRSFPRRPPA
jgi:protein-disulfide isomerase